jgi:class 3 adenylate cyclase
MVEADESGTLARFKHMQMELIYPRVADDGGRIVKTMGDGVLVEFRSVVDALKCAVALQQGAVSAGDQVFCLGGRVTNKRYRKRRTLLA